VVEFDLVDRAFLPSFDFDPCPGKSVERGDVHVKHPDWLARFERSSLGLLAGVVEHLRDDTAHGRVSELPGELVIKRRVAETRLRGWACRTRTRKCRRKLSL